MTQKIKARFTNGALVPLEPLGIEEGASVVFVLAAKAPPGAEPSAGDYQGAAGDGGFIPETEPKTPSQMDEELSIEEDLEKDGRIQKSNRREFRVVPHNDGFTLGVGSYNLKQILNDEDDERYLRADGKII